MKEARKPQPNMTKATAQALADKWAQHTYHQHASEEGRVRVWLGIGQRVRDPFGCFNG